jgi:hypothetical protein
MALLLSLAVVQAGERNANLFPTKKGTIWTYEGTFYETVGRKVRRIDVSWQMKVEDWERKENYEIILVTGYPTAYNWELPKSDDGKAFIIRDDEGRYYLLQEKNGIPISFDRIPDLESIRKYLTWDNLIWQRNLKVGDLFGQETGNNRTDGFYCWRLMGWRFFQMPAENSASPANHTKRYIVGYYTNPDHMIVDYVYGVGVVRYVYVHHGTVCQAYVRLVSIKDGG